MKWLKRIRGWATSGHAANIAAAIADGALTGEQPWWMVAGHLLVAAFLPAPVAGGPAPK
jgi:hypothetical protein